MSRAGLVVRRAVAADWTVGRKSKSSLAMGLAAGGGLGGRKAGLGGRDLAAGGREREREGKREKGGRDVARKVKEGEEEATRGRRGWREDRGSEGG